MQRFLQRFVLMALVVTLNSCGLPGAMGRSTGNLFRSLSNLVPSASASGGSPGGS